MPYKSSNKNREYQRLWKRKQILRDKIEAVALLGGKCVNCGYSNNIAALQIDHIIPKKRRTACEPNQAGKVLRGKIPKEEVQLLCANCHAIKTYEKDRKTFSNYID